MSDVADRKVLITGGASGIGRQMALRLSALGGRILIWDVNPGNIEKVLGELKQAGGPDAYGQVCDVSRRDEVYRSAEKLCEQHGPVDILINNAGIVGGASLLELSDEQIEATFAVNTLSLFWVTKAFLPEMIKQSRGHVVNIASASSLIGVAKLSDYAASKWAAMGFDESLRAELKKIAPRVRTTVVCPFYIDTGLFKGVKTRFPLMLPILKESDVADRVVAAILRDKQRVLMPFSVKFVPLLRMLPVPLFDAIANLLGVNVSMEEFVGRRSSEPSKEGETKGVA